MPFYNTFGNDWIGFGCYFITILAFVFISGILLEKFKVSGETTRQFVHVGVGILVMTSPFTIRSLLQPSLLAIIFIFLNLINVLKGGMKGIHSAGRYSFGTVFFPLSFLILILLYWDRAYILIGGMALMTICDPLGSILGAKLSRKRTFTPWKDKKSIPGSISVFISSAIIIFSLTLWVGKLYPELHIALTRAAFVSVIVGIVAVLSESISFAGSDNLSLPLLSALIYDVCLTSSINGLLIIFGWILFSVFLAVGSYKLGALDTSGSFGAMLLGIIVFSIGGINWALPMVTFYILSSILSRIGKNRKQTLLGIVEKGSRRDIYQVFANGGVAFISAILYWYTKETWAYTTFLGSLAAATADTWATEIGVLSGAKPTSIINFKPLPLGASGGITLPGTIAAVAGATVLTLSGLPGTGIEPLTAGAIMAGGFLGAMIDSIAGATIQAQYRCNVCGKITEKKNHCGSETSRISGIQWINNDVVNLICTFSGGSLAAGLSLIG